MGNPFRIGIIRSTILSMHPEAVLSGLANDALAEGCGVGMKEHDPFE